MSKLLKTSYLCAKLEAIGLESIANKIASNQGIQKIVQYAFSAEELTEELKKKLTEVLLKTEKYSGKKPPKGIAQFKRVDPKDLTDEEKNIPEPVSFAKHYKKAPRSLADVGFVTEKMPKISYE